MRASLRLLACPAVTAGALARVALAADAAHGGGGDPVNVDLWQAIFTVAVFVILLAVLSKTAFKPILAALQNRERFIRESLESAKRDRQESEARLKEAERKLHEVQQQAGEIVAEARRDAEAVARRVEEEAREQARQELDRAKREIGIARDTALKALYEQAADLGTAVAVSVLKREVSPQDHQQLIQETLTQVRERGIHPN